MNINITLDENNNTLFNINGIELKIPNPSSIIKNVPSKTPPLVENNESTIDIMDLYLEQLKHKYPTSPPQDVFGYKYNSELSKETFSTLKEKYSEMYELLDYEKVLSQWSDKYPKLEDLKEYIKTEPLIINGFSKMSNEDISDIETYSGFIYLTIDKNLKFIIGNFEKLDLNSPTIVRFVGVNEIENIINHLSTYIEPPSIEALSLFAKTNFNKEINSVMGVSKAKREFLSKCINKYYNKLEEDLNIEFQPELNLEDSPPLEAKI